MFRTEESMYFDGPRKKTISMQKDIYNNNIKMFNFYT